MPKSELPLPLFIVIRMGDYDALTGALEITQRTPTASVKTGSKAFFPIFTSDLEAKQFVKNGGMFGTVVKCDAERLIDVLLITGQVQVCIDPQLGQRGRHCYDAASLVAWLKKKDSDAR